MARPIPPPPPETITTWPTQETIAEDRGGLHELVVGLSDVAGLLRAVVGRHGTG